MASHFAAGEGGRGGGFYPSPRGRRSTLRGPISRFGSQGAAAYAGDVVPPSDESELEEYESDAASAESELDFTSRTAARSFTADSAPPAQNVGMLELSPSPEPADEMQDAGEEDVVVVDLARIAVAQPEQVEQHGPAPPVAGAEAFITVAETPSPSPQAVPVSPLSPALPQLPAVPSVDASPQASVLPAALALPPSPARIVAPQKNASPPTLPVALPQDLASAPLAAEPLAHESANDTTAAIEGAPEPPRKKRKRASVKTAGEPSEGKSPGPPADYIARAWAARAPTLRSFWSTFAFGEDEEVITRRKLHADVRENSRRYIDLDIMAAQGLKFEEDYNVDRLREGAELSWPRKEDHQHHLVQAAVACADDIRVQRKNHIATTARIAKMVKLYWTQKIHEEEKAKRAEERRIKKLAKWTGREVLKQWKLAIDLVGHQKEEALRKEHELEGRKQLNAILEQSTQMLNMQRADLYGDNEASVMELNTESEDGNSPDSDTEEDDDSDASEEDDGSDEDNDSDRNAEGSDVGDEMEQSTEPPPSTAMPTEGEEEHGPPLIDDSGPSLIDDSGESLIDDSGASLTGSFSGQSSDSDGGSDTSSAHTSPVESASKGDIGTELLEPSDAADRTKWWARFLVSDDAEQSKAAKPGITELDDEEDGAFDDPSTQTPHAASNDVEAEVEVEADASTTDPDHSPRSGSNSSSASQRAGSIRSAKTASARDSLHDSMLKRRGQRPGISRSSSVLSGARGSQRLEQDSDRDDTPAPDHPKVRTPFLLRGVLRPYQHVGLEWLASLYSNGVNGILADEMGLGKTIQTIALLAHLACDYGNWGPHLVVAPTSVMLNWEVEFKKFLPGFKILTYYGTQKERKEKRVGWALQNAFNVCITSYQLTLADAGILRRRSWQYLILDEAHHIKNFRSQRWQTLLGFNSQRRLLLTGTPLQNNLLDLWSLMYFLMPHGVSQSMDGYGAFTSLKDFQDWFSKPIDKAIEAGGPMGDETKEMISKLHTVLRPYLLRRLKKDVEKELPSKHEHVITCRLSKRQRFLYNDFMSRAKTKESLASGSYLSIINCLMQLRKVCNHPDLFEERPIVTSFAMGQPVAADFETKELLIRKMMAQHPSRLVDIEALGGNLMAREHLSVIATRSIKKLEATTKMPYHAAQIPPPLPMDTWSIEVFPQVQARARLIKTMQRWKHFATLNALRCSQRPVLGKALIEAVQIPGRSILPQDVADRDRSGFLKRSDRVHGIVQSYETRKANLDPFIDRFAIVTPAVTTHDLARFAVPEIASQLPPELRQTKFDTLHSVATKLHIAFPDSSLLQYDCGKLQQLDVLMRRLKQGGHRILIFTQMTKMLDILESFLNYHGYRYLRLDGATKVDQRQLLTERFNRDPRIDAFILSTRSGGLGINLVGADTVLFYDLDWNAAIEAQCMDRAHRIGQTRDVHIYRFVSEHTVEENMLRKANQKRKLDSVVIQEGEFNTDTLIRNDWRDMFDEGGQTIAGVPVGRAADTLGADADRHLKAVEDEEDVQAAAMAEEEGDLDRNDYEVMGQPAAEGTGEDDAHGEGEEEEASIDTYMINFVRADWDNYFEDQYGR
ncbi:swr1 complex component [Tilletia horrida]|nr:swr1 complex component [Tilletia horrida]